MNLDDIIKEAAATHGVDEGLLWRVMQAESSGNPRAQSPKGAMGLMQLMPGTAAELGVTDPWDPRENVHGGAKYLRQMLDRFSDDETLAVAAYNAGPVRVEQAGGVPRIPETVNYVKKVLGGGLAAAGRWLGPRQAYAGEGDSLDVTRQFLLRQEAIPPMDVMIREMKEFAGIAAPKEEEKPARVELSETERQQLQERAGLMSGQKDMTPSREEIIQAAKGAKGPPGEQIEIPPLNVGAGGQVRPVPQELLSPGTPEEGLKQPVFDPINVLVGFGTGAITGGIQTAVRSLLGNVLGEWAGGMTMEALEKTNPRLAWLGGLVADVATGMMTDKGIKAIASRFRQVAPQLTEAQSEKIIKTLVDMPEVQEAAANLTKTKQGGKVKPGDDDTIMGAGFMPLGSLKGAGKGWRAAQAAQPVGAEQTAAEAAKATLEKQLRPIVETTTQDKEKIQAWLKGDLNPDEWDMPVHINWDRIKSTDDVQQIYEALAKLQAETFEVAGRGVRPHQVTEMAARLHGMSVEDLLARQKGQAFNAEQVLRSQQIALSAVTELEKRSAVLKALGDQATPEDLADYFRMFKLASELAAQARGGLTETARGLEAAKIARQAQPGLMEKVTELDAFAKGIWGPEDAPMIADYISRLETPAQAVSFLDKLKNGLSKGHDIIYHCWINAMLSGVKTTVANIAGFVNVPWRIAERYVAGRFGSAIPEGEAGAMAFGAWQGLKDGLRLAGQALRTGESLTPWAGRLDIPPERARPISALNFGIDAGSLLGRGIDLLGEIISIPTRREMTAIDALGGSIGYRMELNALAYRQAIKEGLTGEAMTARIRGILNNPEEFDFIHDRAVKAARATNFADDLGPLGQKVQKAFSVFPLKWIGPFVRAGGNLANFVIDRTPLALGTRKFWGDVMSPHAAERSLALAQLGLGSAISFVTMGLAAQGYITGSGPRDPDLRKTWEQTGWQPNSAWDPIGKQYVSFNRADPVGMLLGLSADLFDISHHAEADELDKAFLYLVTSMGRQLTSKTYLKGVSQVLDAWDDPEREGGRFWRNFAGSFIPTIVKDVARLDEPGMRETGPGLEGFVNELKGRIPGLTQDVPPKLDFWAEPLKLQGDWPQAIYDFFSPFQIPTKTEGDRVDEELKRLGYPLRMPSYVLEVGGGPSEYLGGKEIEAVRLNAEQYNRYLEISRKEIKSNGQILKDRLKSVIIADSYKNKPEEQKMYIIKEVIQAYQQTAKAVLLKEYPDLAAQAKASKLGKKGYEPTGQLKAVGGGYGQ